MPDENLKFINPLKSMNKEKINVTLMAKKKC